MKLRFCAASAKTCSAKDAFEGRRRLHVANCYSNRRWKLEGVDTVVLACGSLSNDALYHQLVRQHPNVHRLGDAYAPRRLSFATGQARELVRTLLR